MFVTYVEISTKDVVDKHNRYMGRPYDFLVKLGGAYPHLSALILSKGRFSKNYAVVPWSQIKRIDQQVYLNVAEETVRFKSEYKAEEYTSIRNSILDQQVVDTFNRKVVRVNDVHLLRVDKDLMVAHVDVGFRGLIRRLGWERAVDVLVKMIRPRSHYLTKEHFISWKFVQPLEVMPKRGIIQLNVPHEDLAAIPPADFSEIMDELDPPERIALFRSLDFETQVDVLNELEVEMQKDLMEELDTQTAIRLLEKMDPDEVVDLLGALSKGEANRILSLMSPIQARKLRSLLKYESDSAGGFMTTEFVSLSPTMTVSDAIQKIKRTELDVEMIYYTYVLDEKEQLVGMVTFKQLIMSNSEEKIGNLMMERPVSVPANSSAKEVAFLMDKYDFLAIPVVDDGNVVKGIITIDDILALAIDEAWGDKPGLL